MSDQMHALEVFFAYAHADESLLDGLNTSLAVLKHKGIIETWYDRKIGAGKETEAEIYAHLSTAPVILLLISQHFFDDPDWSDKEMDTAIQRYKAGEASLIPILLRRFDDWEDTPLGELKLKCLPDGDKAVTQWHNKDDAFANITKGIRNAVNALIEKKQDHLPSDVQNEIRATSTQVQRWHILQATQAKLFEIQRDVTVKQAESADKMFKKWAEILGVTSTVSTSALRVFYSYSHRDEKLRNELEVQLSLLRRQGLILSWHDREITGGEEWKGKIDEELERADIILLLISADFIASDYCYDVEMKRAMERHAEGKSRVIPIILRKCLWDAAPFKKLQALPKDGKPVKAWSDRDAAWLNVAQGVAIVIKELQTKAASA